MHRQALFSSNEKQLHFKIYRRKKVKTLFSTLAYSHKNLCMHIERQPAQLVNFVSIIKIDIYFNENGMFST